MAITLNGSTGHVQGQIAVGATGGGSDAVFYENQRTVTTNYTITAGNGAMCTGPLIVNTGVAITVPTNSRLVVL